MATAEVSDLPPLAASFPSALQLFHHRTTPHGQSPNEKDNATVARFIPAPIDVSLFGCTRCRLCSYTASCAAHRDSVLRRQCVRCVVTPLLRRSARVAASERDWARRSPLRQSAR